MVLVKNESIILWFLYVLTNIIAKADIYFVTRDLRYGSNTNDEDALEEYHQYGEPKTEVYKKYDDTNKKLIKIEFLPLPDDKILKRIIKIIKNNINSDKRIEKEMKKACHKHFGSLYGTKMQRILCLKNLKEAKAREKRSRNAVNEFEKAFIKNSPTIKLIEHKTPMIQNINYNWLDKVAPKNIKRNPKRDAGSNIKNFELDYLDMAMRSGQNHTNVFTELENPVTLRFLTNRKLKIAANGPLYVRNSNTSNHTTEKTNTTYLLPNTTYILRERNQKIKNKNTDKLEEFRFSYDYIPSFHHDKSKEPRSTYINKKNNFKYNHKINNPSLRNLQNDSVSYVDVEIAGKIRIFTKNKLKIKSNRPLKTSHGTLSSNTVDKIFNKDSGQNIKPPKNYVYVSVDDDDNVKSLRIIRKRNNDENTEGNKEIDMKSGSAEELERKRKKTGKNSIKIINDKDTDKHYEVEDYDISDSYEDLSNTNNKNKNKDSTSDNSNSVENNEATEKNEYEKETPESETADKKYKKVKDDNINYIYVQGPRHLKVSDLDARKRLNHFLPKRYYWDESDIDNLGYYWFNGPQGKYPGTWKLPY